MLQSESPSIYIHAIIATFASVFDSVGKKSNIGADKPLSTRKNERERYYL